MNTSIQLGMHRPGSEIGYSKDTLPVTRGDIADRACTWFASVALCQWLNALSLSVDLGHGPTAHFDDWTVRAVCEGSSFDDIPSELRHSLMIEKTNHDALLLLSKYARGPFGVPIGDNGFDIIWECERGFDELLSTLEPQLSLTNRLDLQHARLHIQCVYFLYDEDNNLRLPGLLRAYSTASDIVNTILSDETSHDVLPHAPLRVVRVIFNAALVIFRILHSTCAAGLDYKGGRLLFNAAAFSMRQLSVLQKDKDQPLRASEMLRAFWRAAERNPSMSSQAPKLHIKSRLGASLAYDCLLLFRSKSSDNRAKGPDGPTQNNQPLAGEISQNTPSPISNGLPDSMFLPAVPPTDLDLSVFPEGILSISPNIDMTDTLWLQDIGYPAFPDLEVWQR
ncbi:Regulatory protein leu3 [Exophiala xenobiotica]|nr:Regulatory protein leu3 [Exophiala xenobiotica]KAK5371967.1 Regulatory protein leu3 [Exophiala xenobiotica]KAK5482065.1 Regulatory protein leu3 [Exophiala xenobiotica]